MSTTLMVGLGELIWDLAPSRNLRSLGGAPSNFAYHSSLLGNRAIVASRVGDDDLGRDARRKLGRVGVEVDYLQVDLEHPTGAVEVEVDAWGEPHFTINPDSAWDYMVLSPQFEELARRAQVICFGTLGQRCRPARETIHSFLRLSAPDCLRVFDVNLRHSFFDSEMLVNSMEAVNVAKFNSDELSATASMLNISGTREDEISRKLIGLFGLDLVAVTRSGKGSLLCTACATIEHSGYCVEVVDTIGCGDAFTAALAHCLVRGMSLDETSKTANRMGAWVATCAGATPTATRRTIEEVLSDSEVFKH